MENMTRLQKLHKARKLYQAAIRLLEDAIESPAWRVGTPWQSSMAYRQMVCYNVSQARAAWVALRYA